MTTLRLHDLRRGDALARSVLWLVVAVLAMAVAVHHGWVGGHAAMGHGGGSAISHAGTATAPHAGAHHDHPAAGHAPSPTVAASSAAAPGADTSHEAILGLCLAALLGSLITTRPQSLRRIRAHRAARRARRAPHEPRPRTWPGVTGPASWHPPPRGGPPVLTLLCVSRR